jgi:ABC-type Mn2+/Zn2+ transport system permease subunit
MVMQQILLHDDVAVKWEAGGDEFTISLGTNKSFLPVDERNLAYKAAALMHNMYGQGMKGRLRIDIKKRIPVAAGMAGGSGNGAAVLHALNYLWGLKLTVQQLNEAGAQLGSDIPFCIFFFLVGAVPLFMLRWRQNLLSLTDYEAKAIGENVNRLRGITVLCATLLTSSAVAMTGGISWVGLVIPHITRFIIGPDSKKVLPISSLIGALFLLVMDDIARASSVYELPMSVLTSLIGAPIFFTVIIKSRRQMTDGN